MRDNKHSLDGFCYKNFNLFLIILNLYDIIYTNLIYNKKFCLLVIFLLIDHFISNLYYIVNKL